VQLRCGALRDSQDTHHHHPQTALRWPPARIVLLRPAHTGRLPCDNTKLCESGWASHKPTGQ
jgi:hypothetical protein